MSTSELKARIHEMVDGLDESFLNVIHSMLDTYVQQKDMSEVYKLSGEELSQEAYRQEIKKAELDISEGRVLNHGDVKKSVAEW